MYTYTYHSSQHTILMFINLFCYFFFFFISVVVLISFFFFFSSRRRHTRLQGDWSSDVCSSDLCVLFLPARGGFGLRMPKAAAGHAARDRPPLQRLAYGRLHGRRRPARSRGR